MAQVPLFYRLCSGVYYDVVLWLCDMNDVVCCCIGY